MLPLDPFELARWQLVSDRTRTRALRGLFERKLLRMSASPLAFLRGAAPLFYRILADRPRLAEGPPGEGWLCGDMHLENFGAYRPDPATFGKKKGPVDRATFDLNDFDDAFQGPFRFDVLRLTTSLILGGRELGADGVRALELCETLLDAYVEALGGARKALVPPLPVIKLIDQVLDRSRKELLEGRTRVVDGRRRLDRAHPGDRYRDLPRAIAAKVPKAFARYVDSLPRAAHLEAGAMDVKDAALRIAGTGSLGCLRVAVLVRGKGGRDGGFIFDMKEQGAPSGSTLVHVPKQDPATRVATAVRACLAHPPRMVGTTRLVGRSMFVRRLAPQEDKLELSRINPFGDVVHVIHHEDMEPLAAYLGALLGRAHRRGATRLPRAWSREERRGVVERAIAVAGLHEAVYLSICKLEAKVLARTRPRGA